MVMHVAHQFGNRLRELRTENGLLQKDLEEALSLRPGTISQYERGLREPGFDLLVTIADRFAVSLDYLLGRPEAPKASPALVAARRRLKAALGEAAPAEQLGLGQVLLMAEQVAPALFSLNRLAEELRVEPGPLKACRSGLRGLPKNTLAKLLLHLGLPPEWLVGA